MTTDSVKQEMLFDHCTWGEDYKRIMQRIRRELLQLAHVDETVYATILMQGSGTFGVESVVSGVILDDDCLLLLSNGAYGEQTATMCRYHHISCVYIAQDYDRIPDRMKAEEALKQHPETTHVAMAYSETATGIFNDIQSIGELAKTYHKVFIMDAILSLAGVGIPIHDWHIDFLVSLVNKCIQGVSGSFFIIARRELLTASRSCARSPFLDLYDRWAGMEEDGKQRYTFLTHVALVFIRAMEELQGEGGIPTRSKRYAYNRDVLIEESGELGFLPYMEEMVQGPIITTFLYSDTDFDFVQMYCFIEERDYAAYPGKLTDKDTFHVGTISEIYEENILQLAQIMKEYMGSRGNWYENRGNYI